jgi:hypothetical protein
MSSTDVLGRNELSSLEEKPFATYTKTILGQVGVHVWDRFTNTPAYVILKGDPRKAGDEGCLVDVWNSRENAYFLRSNARHFAKGTMRPYQRPENVAVETPIEQYSDEQLRELINMKFAAMNRQLTEIKSVPVIFRMLSLATEMEKSDKIIKALEARIAEIQSAEYRRPEPEATQEE